MIVDLGYEDWISTLAVIAVVVLLPFYIGYVDSTVEILFSYAVVSGLALAVGDKLLSSEAAVGLRSMVLEIAVNAVAVMVFGLLPFALAIWLI